MPTVAGEMSIGVWLGAGIGFAGALTAQWLRSRLEARDRENMVLRFIDLNIGHANDFLIQLYKDLSQRNLPNDLTLTALQGVYADYEKVSFQVVCLKREDLSATLVRFYRVLGGIIRVAEDIHRGDGQDPPLAVRGVASALVGVLVEGIDTARVVYAEVERRRRWKRLRVRLFGSSSQRTSLEERREWRRKWEAHWEEVVANWRKAQHE